MMMERDDETGAKGTCQSPDGQHGTQSCISKMQAIVYKKKRV